MANQTTLGDTPTISAFACTSSTYNPLAIISGTIGTTIGTGVGVPNLSIPEGVFGNIGSPEWVQEQQNKIPKRNSLATGLNNLAEFRNVINGESSVANPNNVKRLVQVYIADPDVKVPVDQSLLYRDLEPRLTDLNDQELFFEIEIKSKLEAHNEKRKKIINDDIKDRQEFLKPIKIRDLKMVVQVLAVF